MNFTEIFNIQFIVLCLLVVAITHVIKAILNPIKENRLIKTVVLPSIAICVGGIVGYIISTVTLGLIAGLLSSLIYAKVKSFIKAK